jgi:uncharacterized membrane-anchored protein YjiN (DUF445 family)
MDTIAEAVEKEWLTPEALRNYLKEVNLRQSIGQALDSILKEPQNRVALAKAASQWADGKLTDTQTKVFFQEKIGSLLPRAVDAMPLPLRLIGRGALGLGLAEALDIPEKLAQAVVEEGREQLQQSWVKGTLDSFLLKEIQQLLPMVLGPEAEETLKEGFIRFFCEHVKPGQVVRKHLDTFSAEDIRVMVESKARKHLEWIRVNGAVGGFLMGCVLEILSRRGM